MTRHLAATLAAAALLAPMTAGAFECPAHFGPAQQAIDETAAGLGELDAEDRAAVEALLDDARTRLEQARASHGNAANLGDHARSIAEADAAAAYARAAGMLGTRLK